MTTVNTNLPLRPTVRVIVRRDRKVCIILNKRDGVVFDYNVPGGGIEPGETPESTAMQECLEEVGIKIQNVREVGVRLKKHHPMWKPERNLIWSGTDTIYLLADFDHENLSQHGADNDAVDYQWMTTEEAVACVRSLPQTEFTPTLIHALEVAEQLP